MHEVHQYRTGLHGVEAVSLKSTRQFPRHSHDQFGIGVITFGGHRSWSNIGWVDAVCGNVIMVNPGEMHDGSSLDGNARAWKMLFFEPELACEILADDERSRTVTLKPTVRDRDQATQFCQLFSAMTDPQPDGLHSEECLVRTLAYAFCHHGSQRPFHYAAFPSIDKIVKLIDSAPERAMSLQAMAHIAGVGRFHFLRAFARATGATPHAYIVQQRIRLARRLLAAGKEPVQASAEAGFADQSHMTRAFVRQLGTTPARYRQVVCGPKSRAISFKTSRYSL
jgi:AraC-like DNA-binding protein